jgi:lipopolysaccharide biosynthesis protein
LDFQDQLRNNLGQGPHYEADKDDIKLCDTAAVRFIAYYLPQFHPIPENDEWWGKGFTEWTNVTKAIPQFEGHYQPHLPTASGFYDLRLASVLREQWELASRHGLAGFCFHYYWFSGRRVLETPLDNLLKDPSLNIPFCINWANENWTRTWDGAEKSVLLAQSTAAEDEVRFIDDILPIINDPRYIRIGDRPLVMIYNPKLIPDIISKIAAWRERFRIEGLAEPYFVMPQAFGVDDPRELGFDAVSGFPPHRFAPLMKSDPHKVRPYNDLFAGEVRSYERLVELASAHDPKDYTLLHAVCPGWDNTARRPGNGLMFAGATPALYGQWLESAARKVVANNASDERIVFINAWNEWAEGAHLEPDRHNGFAFLRETARVFNRVSLNPGATMAAVAGNAIGATAARRRSDGLANFVHWFRLGLARRAERLARFLRPD